MSGSVRLTPVCSYLNWNTDPALLHTWVQRKYTFYSGNNVNTVEYRGVVVTTDVKTPRKVRILCFPQFYMSSVVF